MKDQARIHVLAGGGGDGCMSFRREAHVPKGGPDGGDGGRGGDVVLVCDDSYRDLEHFRRSSHFSAKRGVHGQGSQRHGADGVTLEIPVPPGTEILVEADGTQHDLVRPGQRAVVAKGGSGGRGNRHFSSSTRQSPRFAERGLVGDEGWLMLQLKLLADAGLVGLPNAGKSSLISRLTRATPKVADYPFTTLEPALGTLHEDDRQLVIADIPGLIEGAADGVGLGHDFLAHVERTRLLVHVLDLAPLDGSDPLANFQAVERELKLYQARLAVLPRIVALSKTDLVTPEEGERARSEWQQRMEEDVPVILTSSVTRQGLDELATELLRRIPVLSADDVVAGIRSRPPSNREDIPLDDLPEHRTFRPARSRGFRVTQNDEGAFVVEGDGVDKLVARYDLDNEDALAHLERRLRGLGVIRALEAAGFEPGNDVEIAGVVFELDPS
ncbi:MAG TPA: GTPase ObgE [Solirubrobacteraceae bacterium]|jgi:GTP-binding protein|nr:GTPase ObgE [Solirubrobacteraceae bacterium]